MPTGGYCPYCTRSVDRLTIEHPIPQRIGGTLEIGTCGKCNHDAARFVDNPAMSWPDVEVLRAIYDTRSPKHPKRRHHLQIRGSVAGGATALYRPGREVEVEQVVPSDPVYNADGTFTFSVPEKNASDHLARLKSRVEEEHPGRAVEIDLVAQQPGRAPFEHKWGLAPWVWPRFAAKVAVAVLDGSPAAVRQCDQSSGVAPSARRRMLPSGSVLLIDGTTEGGSLGSGQATLAQ